jgi:hypothetical protein
MVAGSVAGARLGIGQVGTQRKGAGCQHRARPVVPRRVRLAADQRPAIGPAPVASRRHRLRLHVQADLGEQPAERSVQRQVSGNVGGVPRVERLGDAVDRLEREAERLGHLPHRRARPVGDDGADHGRVILAVAVVEVLDHLLATVDVEVDVDVRQRPRLVDEALEQELVLDRVDLGDAQAVGHDRVAGASPSLPDDAALARELHQVPDDQEELRQVGALDDVQLVRQLLHGLLGNWPVTAP